MCCFEDSASHSEAKVENGGEKEKWAISNFFFFVVCLLAVDAFLHRLMEG